MISGNRLSSNEKEKHWSRGVTVGAGYKPPAETGGAHVDVKVSFEMGELKKRREEDARKTLSGSSTTVHFTTPPNKLQVIIVEWDALIQTADVSHGFTSEQLEYPIRFYEAGRITREATSVQELRNYVPRKFEKALDKRLDELGIE